MPVDLRFLVKKRYVVGMQALGNRLFDRRVLPQEGRVISQGGYFVVNFGDICGSRTLDSCARHPAWIPSSPGV